MAFLVAQVVKNPPAVQETPVQFLGQEDPWRRDRLLYLWASLVVQVVKNLPAMWETWVQSVGWEDLLKEGMAAHSSILAWRKGRGTRDQIANICWTIEKAREFQKKI